MTVRHLRALLFGLSLFCLVLAFPVPALPAMASWEQPLALADPAQSIVVESPAIAVDGNGDVHVLWYSVLSVPGDQLQGLVDTIVYRVRDDGVWALPEPIYKKERPLATDTSSPLTSDAALRNALFALQGAVTSARDGKLHIIISSSTGQSFINAPWHDVVRIALILPPGNLGDGAASTIVSGDDGVLHLMVNAIADSQDDGGAEAGTRCVLGCLDILYRRSDGGVLWTRRENLSRFEGEDTNPQVVTEGRGGVHLLWNHAELGASAAPPYLLYRHSIDSGQSWGLPIQLGAPGEGSAQAALGVGIGGRVLVVYGGATTGSVFFQSSADSGASWSAPGLVPGVVSLDPSGTTNNRFSLATDSAGRVHLLMVGAQPAASDAQPQLMHLTWDGQAWSAPAVLPSFAGAPSSPQLQVGRGNRLHAAWISTETDNDGARRQMVWYSSVLTDAPELLPLPTFTPVPTRAPTVAPATPVVLTPTTLPAEALQPGTIEGPPRWEGESLPILFIAVGPALILIGGVVWWASRQTYDGK